jgi:hypothetical protein
MRKKKERQKTQFFERSLTREKATGTKCREKMGRAANE